MEDQSCSSFENETIETQNKRCEPSNLNKAKLYLKYGR